MTRADRDPAALEARIAAEFARVWGNVKQRRVIAAGLKVRFDNGTETNRKMLVAFVARGLIRCSDRSATYGKWYERVEQFA